MKNLIILLLTSLTSFIFSMNVSGQAGGMVRFLTKTVEKQMLKEVPNVVKGMYVASTKADVKKMTVLGDRIDSSPLYFYDAQEQVREIALFISSSRKKNIIPGMTKKVDLSSSKDFKTDER